MDDLRRSIGDLWWRVNRELHDRFRQTFKDVEMPPMSLVLLRLVDKEPGITVSELARRSGTVKSHVSKTIDQLAAQGLVEKRPDPDDQRVLRLYVSETAAEMKRTMEARVQASWAEAVKDLSESELAEVERGLQVLLGAVQKADARTSKDDTSTK